MRSVTRVAWPLFFQTMVAFDLPGFAVASASTAPVAAFSNWIFTGRPGVLTLIVSCCDGAMAGTISTSRESHDEVSAELKRTPVVAYVAAHEERGSGSRVVLTEYEAVEPADAVIRNPNVPGRTTTMAERFSVVIGEWNDAPLLSGTSAALPPVAE